MHFQRKEFAKQLLFCLLNKKPNDATAIDEISNEFTKKFIPNFYFESFQLKAMEKNVQSINSQQQFLVQIILQITPSFEELDQMLDKICLEYLQSQQPDSQLGYLHLKLRAYNILADIMQVSDDIGIRILDQLRTSDISDEQCFYTHMLALFLFEPQNISFNSLQEFCQTLFEEPLPSLSYIKSTLQQYFPDSLYIQQSCISQAVTIMENMYQQEVIPSELPLEFQQSNTQTQNLLEEDFCTVSNLTSFSQQDVQFDKFYLSGKCPDTQDQLGSNTLIIENKPSLDDNMYL